MNCSYVLVAIFYNSTEIPDNKKPRLYIVATNIHGSMVHQCTSLVGSAAFGAVRSPCEALQIV